MCVSSAGYTSGEGIEPISFTVNVLQGDSVTLSCNYTGSYLGTDYLLWYRQYSRSRPVFLILINEDKSVEQKADPPVHQCSR